MKNIDKTANDKSTPLYDAADFEENRLPLKPYYKKDLALRYFPACSEKYALRKLNEWIAVNRSLDRALRDGPESTHDHTYSVRQVKLIFQYLGSP